jgi:eukaryotic-like serine/threonine-protein kinase
MACENCGHENPEGARFCQGCGGPLPTGSKDPTYPLIGQVVGGRYHIVGCIGEGGMGVVYKAEQRLGSTVRRVAVKTLHAELSRDPSITARFHREVGTIAQLEHPNTVKVYDFGSTDDGTLYIAMEFLDGKPLNRVIQAEGALDPKRVGNLLRQIAGSLEEAHRQGIVHRDLKPENVILIERAGEKDVVKLVDFGIAARTESADRAKEQKLTQQGMVLGTPPYMSPEQFTGKALDARSDVYSLGIMTYEMLTGQLPFHADTPWQWATHHMTSQPRSFDEIPAGGRIPETLRRAVLKSLAKEPKDRQDGASQFHAEYMAGLSGVATAPPAARPAAGGGKTEAMPEAAVAAFGVAATQAMPEASPLAAGARMPSPPGPVALPPAPSREQGSGGGKGVIYGLSAAAAVLGVAIVAVGLSGGSKGPDGPPLDLQPTAERPAATNEPSGASNSAEPTTVEPDPVPPTPQREPAQATATVNRPVSTRPSTPKPTTPAQPTPSTGTTGTKPPAQLPAGTPALPPGTPALPPGTPALPVPAQPAATPPAAPVAGNSACEACIKAAAKNEIVNAAAAYAACTNEQAKANCSNRAGPKVGKEVDRLAKLGRCQDGKAVIAAAQRMGVPDARLASARAACP